MKIKVKSAKEERELKAIRYLYEQGVTIQKIFGRYYEWDAINAHLAGEDEKAKALVTVADVMLLGGERVDDAI